MFDKNVWLEYHLGTQKLEEEDKMLLVADISGLKYWMRKDTTTNQFLIDVEDCIKATSATIELRSGTVIDSNLDQITLRTVQKDLATFKSDYLEFWNDSVM